MAQKGTQIHSYGVSPPTNYTSNEPYKRGEAGRISFKYKKVVVNTAKTAVLGKIW